MEMLPILKVDAMKRCNAAVKNGAKSKTPTDTINIPHIVAMTKLKRIDLSKSGSLLRAQFSQLNIGLPKREPIRNQSKPRK